MGHERYGRMAFFSSLYASIQHMHDTLETSEDQLKQKKTKR